MYTGVAIKVVRATNIAQALIMKLSPLRQTPRIARFGRDDWPVLQPGRESAERVLAHLARKPCWPTNSLQHRGQRSVD